MLACGVLYSKRALPEANAIELDVRPRLCTLGPDDRECSTRVRAHWRSPRDESLCLIIVGRPEIKRCWERFTEGRYEIELSFAEDLLVQLRDPALDRVLASEAIQVIREAIELRRRRKQPWNIFY